MALFDLQGVPWRVTHAAEAVYTDPAQEYGQWAAELGVSATESLVEINGNDLATAFDLDYPAFPGSVADAFIATEGGIGFYQAVPGNKTSTAYSLSAQGISRLYGFGTRPNLLLSFHNQADLKIQNGKLQRRYGVTILYAELAYYTQSTVRLYVALRLEPGQIIIHSRSGSSYATPWILTELDTATSAVVQSEQILYQGNGQYYVQTLHLSNNVGLLASPPPLGAPSLVGVVPTVGQVRTPVLVPVAGLGSVATSGRLWAGPIALPALTGTVWWPVVASLSAPWNLLGAGRAGHQAAWASEALSPAQAGHAASWQVRVGAGKEHQATWRMRLETALSASWSIPLRPPLHTLAWGDLSVGRASRVHPWDDCLASGLTHTASWGDTAAPGLTHTASWGDTAAPRASLDAPWGNVATVAPEHVAFWEDGQAPRTSLTVAWDDRAQARFEHALPWGNGVFPRADLTASWADVSAPRRSHIAPWADTASALRAHTLTWADAIELRVSLAHPWSDRAQASDALVSPWQDGVPLSPAPLVVSWSDRAQAERAVEIIWSDAVPGRRAHGLAWGDHPVARATHAAVYADQAHGTQAVMATWDDAVPSRRESVGSWADALPARRAVSCGWGNQASAGRAHQSGWGLCPVARATHAAAYADREAAASAHAAAWSGQSGVSATFAGSWSLTATGRKAHAASWGLASRPAARADLQGRWALLEALHLLSIDNVPEVVWQGQAVPIHAARLSADEDSPVWIAEEIVVADQALWGEIQLGDQIQFSIAHESWTLRVDGKGMSRPQVGELRLALSAVSPLAWLDAPYAAAITLDNSEGPVSARATVAALVAAVGTLRWDLDDWLIPAGALAMSETTPLQAAREIVAALGGLLESDPDGTPVARPRHPVTVPDYAVATPDHAILDADLFAFQVSAAPSSGFNRVVISNEDLSGTDVNDRLEYLDEDANRYDGEMRAWPHPWRPVTLGHTGHPETEIEALGARSHSHTELVEFVAGRGRTEYPVQAITGLTWQHADLGAVSAEGTALIAANAGQSLAWVTYTSLSLDWRVALARDEAVQFVLI